MKKITLSEEITVSQKDKIIDVIKKMTIGNYRFQIVVDDQKLLGTISDGDIRRAILTGYDYNITVTKCMNKKPLVGYVHKSNEHKILLNSVGSIVKFLPVLDKKKKCKICFNRRNKYHKENSLSHGRWVWKKIRSFNQEYS